MEYGDWITVTRPSAQTTDDLGGTTATGTTTVYAGAADVQDLRLVFAPTTRGEAVAYLPDEALSAAAFAVGDSVTVDFGAASGATDGTATGYRVAKVRRLDGALELERA